MTKRDEFIKRLILYIIKPHDVVMYKNIETSYKYVSPKNWFVNYKNKPGIILTERFIYNEKIFYPKSIDSIRVVTRKS